MNEMKYQKSNRYTWVKHVSLFVWISLAIILGLAAVWDVLAQSDNGSWLDPINLSRKPGASEPVSVADELGRTHVIWKDLSGKYYYSREFAGNWSKPMAIDPPFGTRRFDPNLTESQATPLYTPILISDGKNGIHAIWIDRSKARLYSYVNSSDFSEFLLDETIVIAEIININIYKIENNFKHCIFGATPKGANCQFLLLSYKHINPTDL